MKKRLLCVLMTITLLFGNGASAFASDVSSNEGIRTENAGTANTENYEFAEKAEPEEVMPEEEKTQPEEVAPEEEETQPEKVAPEEEETYPEEVAPEEEETQPEEVTPEEEESQPEEVAPEEEESQPEEDQKDEEIPLDDQKKEDATKKAKEKSKKLLGAEPIEWTDKGDFPYITSVTITDENGNLSTDETFNKDGKVNINYYFAIPNDADISAGDMFTVPIPKELELVGNLSERMLDESSGINATWEVSDNKATIRMYEDFGILSNVSGYMSIGCWFSKDMQIDEDNHTIVINIDGKDINIDIHVDEHADSSSAAVSKSGSVANSTTGEVKWTVTVNPDKEDSTLEGIKVADTYDLTMQDYVPGSFKVDGVSVANSNVSFTSTGFEYTFPKGTTPGKKVITYNTKVTKDYVYNSSDTSVKDHVETYMPNGDKSSETDAQVSVRKNNETKQATSFNVATNTIEWTIKVNPHKLNLKDVKVVDTFKGGEILTNTIKYNNKSTNNYTIEGNTITFNLGDIKDTVTITFSKKITDMEVFKRSDGSYRITNEAVITSEGEQLIEVNGHYDVGVGTGNISLTKKGVAKISTSEGQYITWNVTLNNPSSNDYQQINEPITFTDQITEGLTPITGLKIVVHFLDGSSVNETIPLADCYDASTKTFNYTVVPGKTVIGGKTVLPECWYVFTYDTSLDSYSQTTYTNTANVKVGSKTFTAPASVKITYDSSKMLTKSGSYNYKNNTYDWTVVFNQEKKAVENPVIVDKLPEGYVPAYNYITVNSTKILLDGTVKDNITALYDESTNSIRISYTGFVTSKVTINLSAKYSGDGEQGSAHNIVELDADNFDKKFTASNTINYERPPILQKNTNYTQGDTIEWEVPIVLNHDYLRNMTLEDQLIAGLNLDVSSVKLYYANVSSSGKVTASTEEVALGSDAINYDTTTGMFILNLPSDLDTHRSYMLKFNTIIMDKTLELITNSITFKGNNVEEDATSKDIIVKVTSGESGITGEVGSVKILKLDKLTNEPLEGVTFQLLNKNKQVMTSAGWAVSDSDGIAEFKDSVKLDTTYYIQEVRTISGYVYDDTMYEFKVASSDEDKTFEITLTNTPETTKVEGSKTWDDANNQDGKRPASITINLLADGTKIDSATVTEKENWKYAFNNLPKYKDGKEIKYTISEEPVKDYTTEVDKFNVKNTHTPETTKVEGVKTWDDANNQDGKRPASITINLLADGTKVDSATVTEKENWKYAFNDLPRYKDGKEIKYTISEEPVKDYTTEVDKFNVKNTHTPEITKVEGNKMWDDANNQDGKRPASITINLLADGTKVDSATVTAKENWKYAFNNLPKYKDGKEIKYTISEEPVKDYTTEVDKFNVKNTHIPEITKVEGSKTWDDANNQDGKRPASITINLLADGTKVDSATVTAKENWKYAFNNLPKYKDGKEIKYTISEEPVKDYTTEVDKFNVKNTHTPETTKVEGSKTWDDANNQDGKRPASITINLLADGTKVDSATVTEKENWKYAFNDLPKYKDGKEIKYTISEEPVKDYTTEVDKFNVKNTHTPEITKVEGNKTWDDANNQDGKRPASITINLLADGTKVDSATVTAKENWKYAFNNLPKYKDGKEIKYTISEEPVKDYTTEVDKFNVKNTHIPEITKVEGSKTWDDADNQDGVRPESITVNLMANGKKVDTVTVTAEDEWKYSFENLPKFEAGKEIEYTVTEEAVEGYTTEIDGFNIKNTHTPETTKVEGSKTWDDANNQDGKRPASITINLLADGTKVDSATVTEKENWKYAFNDLPKYKDGKEIKYTISEEPVKDYTTEVDKFNVKNTHTPEITKVEGSKTWDDANNQDGKRPASITINLLADGTKIDSATVTEKENWKYAFNNLPKYKDGKEIKYTISEEPVKDYTTEVDKFNVKNTHTPEITKVEGSKTWDDANNQDGVRPESITVNLMANGKKVDTVTVTAEDEWKYSFENLPKFEAGKEIKYTISEDAVEGYETKVDGFNLTNVHKPSKPNKPNKPHRGGSARTGDNSNVFLWIVIMTLSIVAAIAVIFYKRKKDSN